MRTNRTLGIAVGVVLSALVCAPAHASTHKERSQAKTIKTLKKQKASLSRQLAASQAQVDALNDPISGLPAMSGVIGMLKGQVATLKADNATLQGGVAQGVAAIARSDDSAVGAG